MDLINAEQLLDEVPAIAIPQRPFPLNVYAIVEAAADPDRELWPLIDKAVLGTTGNRVLMWLPLAPLESCQKQQPTLRLLTIGNKKSPSLRKDAGGFRRAMRRHAGDHRLTRNPHYRRLMTSIYLVGLRRSLASHMDGGRCWPQ